MEFIEAIDLIGVLWDGLVTFSAILYLVDWIWGADDVDETVKAVGWVQEDALENREIVMEDEIVRRHQDRLGVYICQSPWS